MKPIFSISFFIKFAHLLSISTCQVVLTHKMRSTVLLLISSAVADPCTDLCNRDGPEVCTKGSWTTSEGFCSYYLFRGDPANKDYCYHTAETASICLCTGTGVKPSDAAVLTREEGGGALSTTAIPDIAPLKVLFWADKKGLWVIHNTSRGAYKHRVAVLFEKLRHKEDQGTAKKYTAIAQSIPLIEGLVTLSAIPSFPPNSQVETFLGLDPDDSIIVHCRKAGASEPFFMLNLLTDRDSFFRRVAQLETWRPQICAMALVIEDQLEALFLTDLTTTSLSD